VLSVAVRHLGQWQAHLLTVTLALRLEIKHGHLTPLVVSP
jgi:hypothetical protein